MVDCGKGVQRFTQDPDEEDGHPPSFQMILTIKLVNFLKDRLSAGWGSFVEAYLRSKNIHLK
jgi:hypothetical protein